MREADRQAITLAQDRRRYRSDNRRGRRVCRMKQSCSSEWDAVKDCILANTTDNSVCNLLAADAEACGKKNGCWRPQALLSSVAETKNDSLSDASVRASCRS